MNDALVEIIEHIENYGFCAIYCGDYRYSFYELYNNMHSFYHMIGINMKFNRFIYNIDPDHSLRIIAKSDSKQYISREEYESELQKVSNYSFVFVLRLIV